MRIEHYHAARTLLSNANIIGASAVTLGGANHRLPAVIQETPTDNMRQYQPPFCPWHVASSAGESPHSARIWRQNDCILSHQIEFRAQRTRSKSKPANELTRDCQKQPRTKGKESPSARRCVQFVRRRYGTKYDVHPTHLGAQSR
jgi:hypothetical protein